MKGGILREGLILKPRNPFAKAITMFSRVMMDV
jgi:hypothetical protein